MQHVRRPAKAQQRGVTLVMVALWMGIALAALMVLDIGHLFWQKRELQKIADMAALAGARTPVSSACSPAERSVAQANGLAAAESFAAVPGYWGEVPGATSVQFVPNAPSLNACHVTVRRVVPYFFIWPATAGSGRELVAQATAATKSQLAQLSTRSQLLKLSSEQSPLLNALVGGLLGGQLNVGVLGWQGLANADVQLLDYLDALKIELGLQAGGYEQLLQTDVGVGVLLQAMVQVLERDASTATVALNALRSMVGLAVPVPGLQLKLADLLGLQTGGAQAALETDLNVLELVMASVQVGNRNSALSAGIELPLGVVNASVSLKVIEPPQLSLARDPELARQDPYGIHQIYVRTAQTRLLVSVDLPVLGALTDVVNGLLTLLSPVLNLANLLTGGVSLGSGVQYIDAKVLPSPFRLDIGVDVAAGHAYLTDYQCQPGAKTVTSDVRRAAGDIRVGRWGNSAQEARQNAFSSTSLASIAPVPVVRLDCIGCDGYNKVTAQYFGGLGLKLDVPLVANRTTLTIPVPDGDAFSEAVTAQGNPNILRSLGATVLGLSALTSLPADPRASPAGIRGILDAVSGLLSTVLGVVNSLLVTVLSPLLDPVLNGLLQLLGANLTETGVSARLTCGGGSELVY